MGFINVAVDVASFRWIFSGLKVPKQGNWRTLMNTLKEIEQINEKTNKWAKQQSITVSLLVIWASGLSATKDAKPQESCREARKPCVVFIFYLQMPVWEGSTTGRAAIKTVWFHQFFFRFVCPFNFLWSYSLPLPTQEKLMKIEGTGRNLENIAGKLRKTFKKHIMLIIRSKEHEVSPDPH